MLTQDEMRRTQPTAPLPSFRQTHACPSSNDRLHHPTPHSYPHPPTTTRTATPTQAAMDDLEKEPYIIAFADVAGLKALADATFGQVVVARAPAELAQRCGVVAEVLVVVVLVVEWCW